MIRLLPAFLLAAPVLAQDDGALLRATGDHLARFDVVFDASKVDRSSAEALAASFARLQREQHAVNARYVRLFRQAHLEVLRTFYAPGLVDKQEASYRATAPRADDVACEVKSVSSDKDGVAQALLDTTSRNRETGKPETKRVLLQLRRAEDGGWRLLSIHDETPDKQWKERPLGVPQAMRRGRADFAVATRTTPKKTVEELRGAIDVLALLGHNGRLALQRHFFDILGAFYGPEFAARARGDGPVAMAGPPGLRVEIGEAEKAPGDLARVPVTISEPVPDTDQHSPIAEVAFELKKGEGGWKVVGELLRPHPDQPLQPASENFALLFLVKG